MTYGYDEFEPIDAYERCISVYGSHHIGGLDDDRDKLALVFDTRWIPEGDFGATIRNQVKNLRFVDDLRFTHWGRYASHDISRRQLQEAFEANVMLVQPFDYPNKQDLFVVVVDAPRIAAKTINHELGSFCAYIGCADIKGPSEFDTLLNAVLVPSWQIEREHHNTPGHWIHTLPH